MKKEDFIKGVEESLELETSLNSDTNITELSEWDSLTAMVLVNYVNENFDKKLKPVDLQDMTNVDSLMEIIGKKHFSD